MAGSDSMLLVAFYALNMTGQILLIFFLLTVALSRMNRDMTLINVVISMVIFSTACLLLLYANDYRGSTPRFGLCLTQASLIYASLAMGATGVCCLFFQLWESVHSTSNIARNAEKLRLLLRLVPWLAFFGMFFTSIIVESVIARVASHKMWCRTDYVVEAKFSWLVTSFIARLHPRGYASCILCGVFMVASVILEVHVVVSLFRSWRLRTLRKDLLPLDLMVRLGIFSIYGALCVTAAVVLIWFSTHDSPRYPFIFMSTLPVAIWAVFGTQQDVMRVWTCRRRAKINSIGSGTSSTAGVSTADRASKALAQPATMLTSPYSFMMNETVFSPACQTQFDALETEGHAYQHHAVDTESLPSLSAG